jgi:hypothetical protein
MGKKIFARRTVEKPAHRKTNFSEASGTPKRPCPPKETKPDGIFVREINAERRVFLKEKALKLKSVGGGVAKIRPVPLVLVCSSDIFRIRNAILAPIFTLPA